MEEQKKVLKKKQKAPPHVNSKDPVTGKFVKEIWIKKVSKKLERDLWHLDWVYYRHRYKLPVIEFYKKNFGKTIRIVFRGQSQPTEMTITKEHYRQVESQVESQIEPQVESQVEPNIKYDESSLL